VDFTPFLSQLRENHARASELIGTARMVVCLGSRALLSFVVAGVRTHSQILGVATTEGEGLALVKTTRPQLLFASDRLEEGCGISLVLAVKRHHPAVRILLLVSQEQRQNRILQAVDAHCDSVLLESRIGHGQELTAMRSLLEGGRYLAGSLPPRAALPALTRRETEVLARAAGGDSNQEIADRLIVSIDTVKTHMRSVLGKLGARDRTHAAAIGVRLGLLD
jgi:DNA-binding NarL/FixJ family response regulator